VYDEAAVGVSSPSRQWERLTKKLKVALHDKQRSGHNCTAVMTHKVHGVKELKIGERHIKTDELCSALSMDKGIVKVVFEELGHSDVCARCVP
jgi:hypothetical protein